MRYIRILKFSFSGVGLEGSQTSKKWIRLGFPLVGCGELSEVTHMCGFTSNQLTLG